MKSRLVVMTLTLLMFVSAACGPPSLPSSQATPGSPTALSPATPTPVAIGSVQLETDVVEHGSTAEVLAKLLGKESLFAGDVLRVHDGGEGLLEFRNYGLQLRLFNDTQLGIVSVSAPDTPREIQIALAEGGLTGQLTAPGGQAVVTTPGGAKITVLGTEFFVVYDPASKATMAGNFHGTVQVVSGGAHISLIPGHYVEVPSGQQPGPQNPILASMSLFEDRARQLNSPVAAANEIANGGGTITPTLPNTIPPPTTTATKTSTPKRTLTYRLTPTPTKTATPRPTTMPAATLTNTPTLALISTPTNTLTPMPTRTATPSHTPPPTVTPTYTPIPPDTTAPKISDISVSDIKVNYPFNCGLPTTLTVYATVYDDSSGVGYVILVYGYNGDISLSMKMTPIDSITYQVTLDVGLEADKYLSKVDGTLDFIIEAQDKAGNSDKVDGGSVFVYYCAG